MEFSSWKYFSQRQGSASTLTNLLRNITATATATATSNISQEDADLDASILANETAKTDANTQASLVNIATDYTFYVTNLNDSGNGSLRESMRLSNKLKGPQAFIFFSVAGKIILESPLPKMINTINIIGTSAPGWNKSFPPVVAIDFNGNAGLEIVSNCIKCEISGLELLNASSSGISIFGKNNSVCDCYIHDNAENGIVIGFSSQGNDIGKLKFNAKTGDKLPSNVINNNAQCGIVMDFASNNAINNNFIGLDYTGTVANPNGAYGIYILNRSSNNTLGSPAYTNPVTGEENDPTGDKGTVDPVFVIPPYGNVISGNGSHGIVIQDSTNITVLGNFVGTDCAGIRAVSNGGSGAFISNSSYIDIMGCSINDNPFVYYNIFSGNKGDGIEISDAQNVTIQGNFVGIASNNAIMIPNSLNGIRVGRSTNYTLIGGIIPLGNVISGNTKNGIYVTSTANNFETYNTFGGLFAFGGAAPNGKNGMMIDINVTNVTVGQAADERTNVFSGNKENGIKIMGSSNNIKITAILAGLSTNGKFPLPNGENGIFIGENSSKVTIGNEIDSIVFKSVISGNKKAGIYIDDNSTQNTITNITIGLDINDTEEFGPVGNGGDGILINADGNIVTKIKRPNVIAGNGGHGIRVLGINNIITQNYVGVNQIGDVYENALQPEILGNSETNTISDNILP